jgi:phosphoserine phosphatase RsbU/P
MSVLSASSTVEIRPGQSHRLQCMEIIGGNRATERLIASPGMDIWVSSRPFKGNAGGDLHYFSMCGSGRVTRLAIADVSGHGMEADPTAQRLRQLMRKYINLLDQTRLAQAINSEFPCTDGSSRFATVLFVTYFAPTDHLIICNAGHPHPIWFSRRTMRWQVLDGSALDTGPSIREEKTTYRLARVANLPLGIIKPTHYYQFAVKLEKDDLVLVYTDALIDAINPQGTRLREEGLRHLAEQIETSGPEQAGRSLLGKVDEWRGHAAPEDDQTLIVLHHNASDPPRMTMTQAVRSTVKMLGLVRV